MSARYLVKPKAVLDLDDYAGYLVEEGSQDVALRFLDAAYDTFVLLATAPQIGWRPWLKYRGLESVRLFRVSGFERILILYRPSPNGVEILRVVHGSRNLRALLLREGIE